MNRDHFEDLYVGTRTKILGYLLRRTQDPADAADLLAETYLTRCGRNLRSRQGGRTGRRPRAGGRGCTTPAA